jgi:zinc protease
VMRRAERHFASIPEGTVPERIHAIEPEQVGERRVVIEREGTTGYVKVVYHAPAATDDDFFPMLVLDAVLTGAKGVNLWSSFRGVPPQRKARLYTALVERGLASTVSGAVLPTLQPYLYTVSLTAIDGVPLAAVEAAAFDEIDRVRMGRVEPSEVERAKHQLRARLVFDNDSVTNIAHQLGYFETVAGPGFVSSIQRRIESVTPQQIWDVARRRLIPANRTVGWFRPVGGS